MTDTPNSHLFRPRLHLGTVEIPVHHMRGGTSTGIVLWRGALPVDEALLEELLRHLMGVPLTGLAPGNKQITGLGRGIPTSNKVFIVNYDAANNRIASTLAQLAADKSAIDWSVNCGNMSAALPFFALDAGWLNPSETFAEVEIYNTNTNTTMLARLKLKDGEVNCDTQIPGVNGSFPGVDLFLQDPVGSKTGLLFPTGNVKDCIGDVDVTCVDVSVPMIIVKAADLKKTGYESPEELDGDVLFKDKLRELWTQAGMRMKLRRRDGELMSAAELSSSETTPKICIVSEPREHGHINTRYFTPQNAHPSLAVSGGCCLASASLIEGTVAHDVSLKRHSLSRQIEEFNVVVENPAGSLETVIKAARSANTVTIQAAAYRRNAQILLKGTVPLYRSSKALIEALSSQTRGE